MTNNILPAIGEPLNDRAAILALPPGTTGDVDYGSLDSAGTTWRVIEGQRYQTNRSEHRAPLAGMRDDGGCRVTSYPAHFPQGWLPPVGTLVNDPWVFEEAPVGTRFRCSAYEFIKDTATTFLRDDGSEMSPVVGVNTIVSYGDSVDESDESDSLAPGEYESWMLTALLISLRAAHHNSVRIDVVRNGLAEIGIGTNCFVPGVEVPAGRLAPYLHDGEDHPRPLLVRQGDSVYSVSSAGVERVVGDGHYSPTEPVLIVQAGRAQVSDLAPRTYDELVEVKQKVYRTGMSLKTSQSWCSVAENTLAEMGLDQNIMRITRINGFRLGQVIERSQAAALPEGTVLRGLNSDGNPRREWYIRTSSEAAKNRQARTTALYGTRHSAPRMLVEHLPDGERWRWRVTEVDLLEELPVGTILDYNSVYSLYIKAADGRWVNTDLSPSSAGFAAEAAGLTVPTGGRHLSEAFRPGQNTVNVVYVPGVLA